MYAIRKIELLLELLLEEYMDHHSGVVVEIEHDGSPAFSAFNDRNLPYGTPLEGGNKSEVYKKCIRVSLDTGNVWIAWYYDSRKGDRKWGAGAMAIANEGVEDLIATLMERRYIKLFWLLCAEEAEKIGWGVTADDDRVCAVGIAGSGNPGG